MIRFGTDSLRGIHRGMRAALTFLPFFSRIDLKTPQEEYFLDAGVDDGRALAARTIKARRKRWGYYKRPTRSRVQAEKPYGVWTGNTLEHTWNPRKARFSKRPGVMTVQHSLKRRITDYWNLRILARHLEPQMERHFQTVLDGRPLEALR